MHTTDEWTGCYPSNWKGVIVPEAMAHPAKYSSKLIRRIYEHLFQEGWAKPGDNVIDPFGGVALGALDAMRLGLNWYGVELEAKFAGLGNQNIDKWLSQFGTMPRWGSAHLFNGDSRNLLEVIGTQAQVAVSSPPYAETPVTAGNVGNATDERWGQGKDLSDKKDYGSTPGQLGAMKAGQFDAAISSPPYADTELTYKKNGLVLDGEKYQRPYMDGQGDESYGATPGQLGAMKAGQFDAAISSPPFLQSEGGTPEPKPGGTIDAALYARHAAGNKSADGYGQSEGQLSSMKDGGFDAAVSSPPYNPPMSQEHNGSRGGKRGTTPSEPGAFVKYGSTPGQLEGMGMEGFDAAISSPPFAGSQQVDNREKPSSAMSNTWQKYFGDITDGVSEGQLANMPAHSFDAAVSSPPFEDGSPHNGGAAEFITNKRIFGDYGDSEGQLGNDSGDDFWLAARAIVEQVYQALTPGGHACWVVKDYVKNKQIVPFGDRWRQLCEAVGFVTVHEHHAMLVHHKGTQHTLEGGTVERKTESKSFFRRLAEKNGSPRIDWETVYCMVKPEV